MHIPLVIRAGIFTAVFAFLPGRAEAQGPSATRFETVHPPEFECALSNCSGLSDRRRSRLGHSVLVGALIGAGVGLAAGVLAYEVCTNSESSETRDSCAGSVALVFGVNVAIGAAIGLLVGASEPSRGPVPTD
jgi:hypothetical protein